MFYFENIDNFVKNNNRCNEEYAILYTVHRQPFLVLIANRTFNTLFKAGYRYSSTDRLPIRPRERKNASFRPGRIVITN